MNRIFTISRFSYRKLTTIGKMKYPEGDEIRYTLEDCVRAWGIKDKKNTAIPHSADGVYNLSVRYSNRFKKVMPCIYTGQDKTKLSFGGISFVGVLMHGGNDIEDVEACVAVARNYVSDQAIQGNCVDEIIELIQKYERAGDTCYLKVINLPQAE